MVTYIILGLCFMQMVVAFSTRQYDLGLMSLVALIGWFSVLRNERANKNERQDLRS